MDKRTAERQQQGLHTIKAHMPQTYAEIQRQAGERGGEVYRLVRQGCGGEPSRFYAIEAGHVVGTPFAQELTDPILAQHIVQFGLGYLLMMQLSGSADGAH